MIAYTNGISSVSLSELNLMERRIAAFLLESGCKTAAIFGGKSPSVFAAVRACLAAGVCYIPIDENTPPARCAEMVGLADLVLYDCTPINCDCKAVSIAEALACEPAEKLPEIPPGSAAYIIFTSGTTGKPKGIRVSRRNLTHFSDWLPAIPAIAEEKPRTVLNQARFSFDLSVADICCSYFGGMSLCAPEAEILSDFPRLFGVMRESGAEMAVFTPSFAEMCLCDSSFGQNLLPRLRVIFLCGEVLKPVTARKLLERFQGVRLLNAYGPSETTCAVCACEITREMTSSALPVGELSSAADRVLIIGENGAEVGEGERGEVVICGESVGEYVNGGGGYGEIGGKRCFYTGDMGEIRDGLLYLSGRRDRQIKVLGHRIEPADAESNLCEIKGVRRAAVRAEQIGRHTALVGYVEADKGVSAEEIRSEMKKRLPPYMIPRRIVLTDKIPINANGKTVI